MTALATLLIPAWNEASVIGRTLTCLQTGLARGQLKIVVIANACQDQTAAVARRAAPDAVVLETPVPGKCHALNLGLAHAVPGQPVICLDADLDVTAADLLALIAPLLNGSAMAACGDGGNGGHQKVTAGWCCATWAAIWRALAEDGEERKPCRYRRCVVSMADCAPPESYGGR